MALERRGWRQTEGTNWNLQWGEKERVNDVFEEGLAAHQRTNHFRLWSQVPLPPPSSARRTCSSRTSASTSGSSRSKSS